MNTTGQLCASQSRGHWVALGSEDAATAPKRKGRLAQGENTKDASWGSPSACSWGWVLAGSTVNCHFTAPRQATSGSLWRDREQPLCLGRGGSQAETGSSPSVSGQGSQAETGAPLSAQCLAGCSREKPPDHTPGSCLESPCGACSQHPGHGRFPTLTPQVRRLRAFSSLCSSTSKINIHPWGCSAQPQGCRGAVRRAGRWQLPATVSHDSPCSKPNFRTKWTWRCKPAHLGSLRSPSQQGTGETGHGLASQ